MSTEAGQEGLGGAVGSLAGAVARREAALLNLVNEVAHTANALHGGLNPVACEQYGERLWAALAEWRGAVGIPGDSYPLAASTNAIPSGLEATEPEAIALVREMFEGWYYGDDVAAPMQKAEAFLRTRRTQPNPTHPTPEAQS